MARRTTSPRQEPPERRQLTCQDLNGVDRDLLAILEAVLNGEASPDDYLVGTQTVQVPRRKRAS